MTRHQQWARESLERVMARKGADGGQDEERQQRQGEYRSLCLKMPALLKQSGMVQALAFMRSRAGDGDSSLGKAFCSDLARVYGQAEEDPGLALLKKAQKAALAEYLAMTREIIDISIWFRRFAQSELKEPKSKQSRSSDEATSGTR